MKTARLFANKFNHFTFLKYKRVLVAPPKFGMVSLFNLGHSNRFVTEFHVMSIFTSLMYNDAEHLFLYASLSVFIFFGEESVQTLLIFKT